MKKERVSTPTHSLGLSSHNKGSTNSPGQILGREDGRKHLIRIPGFSEKQEHMRVLTYTFSPGLQSTHKWTGDLNLAGSLDGQWRIAFPTPAEERSRGGRVLRESKTPHPHQTSLLVQGLLIFPGSFFSFLLAVEGQGGERRQG